MKIKEMFKKITAGIGAFFATVSTKVLAAINPDVALLYGIEPPKRAFSDYIFEACLWLLIPLILIIGIYFFIKWLIFMSIHGTFNMYRQDMIVAIKS